MRNKDFGPTFCSALSSAVWRFMKSFSSLAEAADSGLAIPEPGGLRDSPRTSQNCKNRNAARAIVHMRMHLKGSESFEALAEALGEALAHEPRLRAMRNHIEQLIAFRTTF